MLKKQFVITKKISKQGSKSIIYIPTCLNDELKPSMVVKVTIDVIREAEK